jgi:SecD/SecF fusion protein
VVEPTTLNPAFMAINDLLVKEQNEKAKAGVKTEPKEDLADALKQNKTPQDSAASELEKSLASAVDSTGTGLDSLQNLSVSPLFSLSSPPYTFRYALKDTADINRIFSREDVMNRLPRNVGVFWGNKADKFTSEVNEEPKLQLYFLDLGRSRKAEAGWSVNC